MTNDPKSFYCVLAGVKDFVMKNDPKGRKQGFSVDPFYGRARCSSMLGAFKINRTYRMSRHQVKRPRPHQVGPAARKISARLKDSRPAHRPSVPLMPTSHFCVSAFWLFCRI